ncbi:MAG: multicopper oxidase family protein [Acidobacteriaceae bacterium]
MNRREFLRSSSALTAATAFARSPQLWAQARADYTLQIAPFQLEIAPGKIIKTTAVNGTVPGPLIRVREGAAVTIDVVNHTTIPEIVHWHGLHIPSLADGASQEGSPMAPPRGGVARSVFTARPAGTRWYHSHIYAGHHLERATFSGEFGFFIIDPVSDPARYDQEVLLALHDWDGYIGGAADGYQQVMYKHATINGRMLGDGDPIRVRKGERALFRIVNSSATLIHTLAFPGHQFLVTALDGNPVPNPRRVDTLVLGPAERVDAVVLMNQPGVWVLGEVDDTMRKSGMGIVVEYANQSGSAQWRAPAAVDFRYELFADKTPRAADGVPEITIPLTFRSKFEGYGDFDHWTINGLSWPKTKQISLTNGTCYRLLFDNDSNDIHPVHLHRHTFELRMLNGKPTSGIRKDVVLLPTHSRTEVVFTANQPGKTLFHCHQQDHMDSGFMMLFDYA